MSPAAGQKSLVLPIHSHPHTHKEHNILTSAEATAFSAPVLGSKDTPHQGLTIQHIVRNQQRFVSKFRILKRADFWNVYKWSNV